MLFRLLCRSQAPWHRHLRATSMPQLVAQLWYSDRQYGEGWSFAVPPIGLKHQNIVLGLSLFSLTVLSSHRTQLDGREAYQNVRRKRDVMFCAERDAFTIALEEDNYDAAHKVMRFSPTEQRISVMLLAYIAKLEVTSGDEVVLKKAHISAQWLVDSGLVFDTALALYTFSALGSTNDVEHLLKHGVDPSARVKQDIPKFKIQSRDCRDVDDHVKGCSPLLGAVKHKHSHIVDILLLHGARPSALDLDIAVKTNQAHVIDALLSHGAWPSTGTLNWAMEHDQQDVVEKLLSYGG
eukprot:gnl/TRDRNA2_/TRDRNA2_67377_c0_seq1.p1 gnl/TRDRNA2_/TRDRNA2_67377_c0~~gnl/TRDRNA2_/TRDRNA2_67377_c0_seq1.p1  ORF type:complete len:294 (-),score=21.73 gnl/TRDRNA2_/TRDRNA2_67377_c0_seq1:197-1078(-)